MTRKISINGSKFCASKSEALKIAELQNSTKDRTSLKLAFATWYEGAVTDEAKRRRLDVGIALNLLD